MADCLYYVYAIMPPEIAIEAAPVGVDDARVELISTRDVAALVGCVDATAYGAGIDDRIADVASRLGGEGDPKWVSREGGTCR